MFQNSIFHRLFRFIRFKIEISKQNIRKDSMKLGSEGSNLVKNNVIKFSDIREESNDGKGWNTSLFMCVKCLNRYIAMVYPSDWFTKDLVCPKCFRQGSLIIRNAEELELDDRAAALRINDLEEENDSLKNEVKELKEGEKE